MNAAERLLLRFVPFSLEQNHAPDTDLIKSIIFCAVKAHKDLEPKLSEEEVYTAALSSIIKVSKVILDKHNRWNTLDELSRDFQEEYK